MCLLCKNYFRSGKAASRRQSVSHLPISCKSCPMPFRTIKLNDGYEVTRFNTAERHIFNPPPFRFLTLHLEQDPRFAVQMLGNMSLKLSRRDLCTSTLPSVSHHHAICVVRHVQAFVKTITTRVALVKPFERVV